MMKTAKRMVAAWSVAALLLAGTAGLTGCGRGQTGDMVDMGGWQGGAGSGDPAGTSPSDMADGTSGATSDLPKAMITPDCLTLGGKKVYFGEDVSPLLAVLGQWKELVPCMGGTSDTSGAPINTRKQYAYDGFSLLTYPDGGVDRLDSVILTSESAVTGEGLHIGMQEEKIAALFGDGGKSAAGVYSFTGGGVRVQLAVQAGRVALVRYARAQSGEDDLPLILLSDVTVELGSAIPFREHILLVDGTGEKVDLYDESRVTFDGSTVDPMKEGSYPLTVTLTGSGGKTVTRHFTVYVVPKTITEQTTREYVQSILAGSLAERLQGAVTNEEKLQLVFDYITKESGMQYVETSNKDNPYYVEAYNGFTTLRGDCYTYCCMGQAMLDALEIDYHVVTRSGERRSNHFWLLADFGDGWYHFDTCYHAFRWKKATFKLTDGEAAAFTAWYNTLAPGWNYYQFDEALYPRTPVLGEDGSYTRLPYTLTYTAGEGGSVIGGGDQQVLHGETGEYVTAVPDEGYSFRRWSDGLSTPMRSDLAKGDLTVSAEFVPVS